MRAFLCPNCHALVYFQDLLCVACSSELAFDRASDAMRLAAQSGSCANRTPISCNWTADGADGLCSCCSLTRTRPADDDPAGLAAWAETETGKRHLVWQLDRLGLPTTPRSQDPEQGLAFDLLSSENEQVTTGHADGIVTIDLAEGADPHREALRIQLAEPYRTMLGHLRHETGHWYWQVLIDGSQHLDAFRALFGDETVDYADALQEHYGKPDDGSWKNDFVSHYAAAHPWEDWAETFAHYLHIRDTFDTAGFWQVDVGGPDLGPELASPGSYAVHHKADPQDFDALVDNWLPLTFTLNAFNRAMGKEDLYPFVLTPAVLEKIRFVHDVVVGRG